MTHPGANYSPSPAPQPGSDFFTVWGIKPSPARPQKATLLLQSLWAYAAASVLSSILGLIAAASLPYYVASGYLVSAAIIGLVFGAASLVIAWFVVKEKLGQLGAADPRIPVAIGLGILGFFAFFGFMGGWNVAWYSAFGVLLGLAQLGAVALGFAMLYQPETQQWLMSRPGNVPTPGPQQPYGTQPPYNPGQQSQGPVHPQAGHDPGHNNGGTQ